MSMPGRWRAGVEPALWLGESGVPHNPLRPTPLSTWNVAAIGTNAIEIMVEFMGLSVAPKASAPTKRRLNGFTIVRASPALALNSTTSGARQAGPRPDAGMRFGCQS